MIPSGIFLSQSCQAHNIAYPSSKCHSRILDITSTITDAVTSSVADWICGGQWNRMLQFLHSLVQTLHAHNLHLAVYFNGALERPRMHEWVRNQLAARSNIYQVLRHLHTKGTPPPKVWWVPPSGLRTALRLALRHLKVAVVIPSGKYHSAAKFSKFNFCFVAKQC